MYFEILDGKADEAISKVKARETIKMAWDKRPSDPAAREAYIAAQMAVRDMGDFCEKNKANHDAIERLFTSYELMKSRQGDAVLSFLKYNKPARTLHTSIQFEEYRAELRRVLRVLPGERKSREAPR